MIIRQEQMEALRAYMRQSFEDRTVKHIAEVFPGEFRDLLDPGGSDRPVRELIGNGIEKASKYDIKAERNVTLFIDLMVGISPDFDDRRDMPWASGFLEDRDIPEDSKMNLIYQRLQAEGRSTTGQNA